MSGKYKHQGEVREVYDVTEISEGLKLERRRRVEFTHQEALRFLDELEEFVGDRKLKQSHVDYLHRAMLRGTFHPEWVSLITCSLDGAVYRMNGQHTAWARLEMPEDWECEVEVIEYSAKSEHDMRMLYSSIDRSSPRTKANVITSYLAGVEEFRDVKTRTLRVVPQGFSLWFWVTAHERKKYDGDDISYLLKTEHYDLAVKVSAFVDSLSPRLHPHMFRSSVVAAMFATFHKAPQISRQFWQPVADGVGFERRGDSRLRLRTWLMQTAVGVGMGAASNKQRVSPELMFRQCIGCWNAFREGRTLQYLRASERGKRATVK